MSNTVLDFKNIKTRDEFHNLMVEAFSLESYYGKNLDALWDMLTEKDNLSILIMNADKANMNLGEYGKSILKLFSDLGEIEGNKVDFIYSGCHIEDVNFDSKDKGKKKLEITIKDYNELTPNISDSSVILEGARIIGDIYLGEDTSVWYNATIRADYNSISIGKNSNIQDNAVVHLSHNSKVEIGENVTIGHSAIIHGAKIGDNVIIGMGAIILDDAVIEENCIVGAGSLVTKGKVFEKGSLIMGSPAKFVRSLTDDEILSIKDNAISYVKNSKEQRK